MSAAITRHTALLVHPHRGPAAVQLTLSGAMIQRAFGRVNRLEHVRAETHPDADTARKVFEDRIFRLVSKGYRVGHHNPALIELIAATPDEPEPYQVYADWLAARGDARAELIARTQTPRDASALQTLLQTHRWQFIRRDWPQYECTWWMGFVQAVRLPRYWGWWSPMRDAELDGDTYIVRNKWARSLLLSIRRHPSGRFLRRFEEEYRTTYGPDGRWVRRVLHVAFDFDREPWVVRVRPVQSPDG